MNGYSSTLRTYSAPNLFETVISPPVPITLPAGTVSQIVNLGNLWKGSVDPYPQSNLVIRRMGLFSNFADGLVFGTPSTRPSLQIEALKYTITGPPHAGAVSIAGKALTGVGTTFTMDIAPGAYIYTGGCIFIVDAVADNLNATVTQYAGVVSSTPIALAPYWAITIVPIGSGNIVVTLPLLETMNCLYECDKFVPIALYGSYLLLGSLRLTQNMTLETISIDPDWDGKPLYLDLGVEIEITPTNP